MPLEYRLQGWSLTIASYIFLNLTTLNACVSHVLTPLQTFNGFGTSHRPALKESFLEEFFILLKRAGKNC